MGVIAVTIEEIQTRLPELLDQLRAGDEFLIVADGQPVGRLLPAPMPAGSVVLGRGKGKLVQLAEDGEHKDFADYLR